MIALSLIAVVYIGLVALVQTDMKKLIAYSSISHMGFVTLGFFIFNAYGVEGALVQMISHGFVSAALFLCVGVMYDRMHTRLIADYGGVVNTMPKFAAFMMLFAMANSGLPATSGFVGEFMVIMGAMKANFWLAFVAATTLIFGAAYTLWMYKRVIFGAVANDARRRAEGPEPRGSSWCWPPLAVAVLLHGRLPAAVHRGDARLGRRAAAPRGASRSYDMTSMIFLRHLPAFPEMLLLVGTCVVLLVDVLSRRTRAGASPTGSRRARCCCASCSTLFILRESAGMRTLLFNGMFVADVIGHVLKLVCYVAVSAALVYSRQYLLDRGLLRGEFFVLLLFALLGMMVMISAASFLTLYLGLELMSLCLYALVALQPRLGARHRGGDEVLRARRAGLGPAALRHVDDLRRHRHARHRRGRAGTPRACRRSDSERTLPGVRPGVRGRRPRLQARRGAVPHVGPRRVPRRADRGDAVRSAPRPSSPRSPWRCACW